MSRKAKFLTAVISECVTATKKGDKYPWKKSNIFKLKWDELKDEPYEGTGQFFIGFPSNKEIIKEANKLNIDYDVVFVKSPTTFYTHNVSGLYNKCNGRVIGTGTINTQEDQVIDKKGNIIKKTKITKDGPIIYHTAAEEFLKNLTVKEKKTKMKKIKIVPKKKKAKIIKIKILKKPQNEEKKIALPTSKLSEKIKNPITGRMIRRNGATHKKLIKQGLF